MAYNKTFRPVLITKNKKINVISSCIFLNSHSLVCCCSFKTFYVVRQKENNNSSWQDSSEMIYQVKENDF